MTLTTGTLASFVDTYTRARWATVPTQGKKALVRLARYRDKGPTDRQRKRMMNRKGITGLKVLLGNPSAGLYCRDFDDPVSYQRWANAYPHLALELPTVQTGRGFHVYARGDTPVRTIHFPGGGSLLGHGAYADVPPSIHTETGRPYEWVWGCWLDTPNIEPSEGGFEVDWGQPTSDNGSQGSITTGVGVATSRLHVGHFQGTVTDRVSQVGRNLVLKPSEQKRAHRHGGVSLIDGGCIPDHPTISGQWESTAGGHLPNGPGHNDLCLWRLARRIKQIAHRYRWSKEDVDRLILTPWLQQNRYLKDPVEVYRQKFFRQLERVSFPIGGSLEQAWAASWLPPFPPQAFCYSDPLLRRLIFWCHALAQARGGQAFYLSSVDVARKLGCTPRTAQQKLSLLRGEGVLILVARGKFPAASTYRYATPLVTGWDGQPDTLPAVHRRQEPEIEGVVKGRPRPGLSGLASTFQGLTVDSEAVLGAIGQRRGAFSLQDLVEQTRVPMGTVAVVVRQLQGHGVVEMNEPGRFVTVGQGDLEQQGDGVPESQSQSPSQSQSQVALGVAQGAALSPGRGVGPGPVDGWPGAQSGEQTEELGVPGSDEISHPYGGRP